MKIGSFALDIDTTCQLIKKQGFQRIALQLPEGLKLSVFSLVEAFEKETNAEVIVVADPCYGACDIVGEKLKHLHVEAVIQVGHTSLGAEQHSSIPMFFINALSTASVDAVVVKACSKLTGKNIGVVTTAQHLHKLDQIQQILKNHGFEAFLGTGSSRLSAPGQILGCDFSSALSIEGDVDFYLYIGSGRFHPLGLLLSTKKPVVLADPTTGEIVTDELESLKDTVLRQRYGCIATAKTARSFGVLVGSKAGQSRIDTASRMKQLLTAAKKKNMLIVVDYLTPEILESFRGIDCFVSTLCPRLALDDAHRYKLPLLTPVELEIVLGVKTWEEYTFDTFANE